ncbi:PH domain-containing protein [Pontibacillus salicampi]|uniref:PH domain-containing protein n=1 Tax=Pontibacillus salicampi TaxID=1449801 RepID=A0ABV6LKF0_9BACI
MFKKVASDALGLSDVGKVVKREDFDKVDADDYVMHEDGETIYFLIMSQSDEYCFTNKALIHLDGTSATSKKRTLHRYDYYSHSIRNVALETAGTVDLDVEIKFTMGNQHFSIDVHKKNLEELKDLYKTMLKIQEIHDTNEAYMDFTKQSLDYASNALNQNHAHGTEMKLSDEFKQINQHAFNWLAESREKYTQKDFGSVFERYIQN